MSVAPKTRARSSLAFLMSTAHAGQHGAAEQGRLVQRHLRGDAHDSALRDEHVVREAAQADERVHLVAVAEQPG